MANGLEEIGAVQAVIHKVQTTIDGGARITLDLGCDSVEVIKKLINIKMQSDSILHVGFALME